MKMMILFLVFANVIVFSTFPAIAGGNVDEQIIEACKRVSADECEMIKKITRA